MIAPTADQLSMSLIGAIIILVTVEIYTIQLNVHDPAYDSRHHQSCI